MPPRKRLEGGKSIQVGEKTDVVSDIMKSKKINRADQLQSLKQLTKFAEEPV